MDIENAIKRLRYIQKEQEDMILHNELDDGNDLIYYDEEVIKDFRKDNEAIETLLNEYTRQKEINAEHQKLNGELRAEIDEIIKSLGKAFYTKDIKDSEKIISAIDFLVDEFHRLEDIEDRKVQIEYDKVFNKGVKSVEDKIKLKIENYNKELEHIENGEEFENEKPMYYWGKVALGELLEDK